MKLKTLNTLKLVSQYPLIILFVASSYFLFLSYRDYDTATTLNPQIQNTRILGPLLSELSKERALSAAYHASQGSVAKETLEKQRTRVNSAMKTFYDYFQTHTITPHVKTVMAYLTQMVEVRQSVDAISIDFNNMFFDFYGQINAHILKEFESMQKPDTLSKISNLHGTLVSIYKNTEYLAQEGGFISKILGQKTLFTDNDLTFWITLMGKADRFDYTLIDDNEAKIEIAKLYQNSSGTRLEEDITKASIELLGALRDGEYQTNPTSWITLINEKISRLEESSFIINMTLDREMAFRDKQLLIQFCLSLAIWIFAFVLLFLWFSLLDQFKKNLSSLEGIFRKVESISLAHESVDFNTVRGMNLAYDMIDKAIESITKGKRNAEEASIAKSIFLANMSHEIRTPINGIIGFTELLKSSSLDDESKEFVDVIEKSSENLLSIINNILDLSKIESNKIEIDEMLFSPIDEFENAIDVYGPKAAEKNIQLSLYIDPSLHNHLKGDVVKIKEVLINLMSNAVKFTPANGEITVEIKRLVNGPPEKARILFSVYDSGIGIRKDKIGVIFDAFNQADSTITRNFGGTGLGLTISSKYIALMGGVLDVISEEGKGSKFYFVLDFIELEGTGENYKNRFSAFNCALYASSQTRKAHTEFIYDYFQYFGSQVHYYAQLKELQEMVFQSQCNMIVADYNDLSKEDLEIYKQIKIPIILIFKSIPQSKSSEYSTKYITPIYEPINVSKLIKILEMKREFIPTKESTTTITPLLKAILGKKFQAHALVAEDNEINQKLIKKTLEDLGLTTTLVPNGLEALKERKTNPYDIVFMDIAMPVMDGIESTHNMLEYEEDNHLPHVPIVAITANALKGDRERFMKEGLDEYITKPIKKENIISILNLFLRDKIDFTAQERSEEQMKPYDVLVFKKSPIETKIFTSVLSKMFEKIESASSYSIFKEKIEAKHCRVILFDKEVIEEDLFYFARFIQELSDARQMGDMHTIMFIDPKEEIEEDLFSATLPNQINKKDLELLLKKFI